MGSVWYFIGAILVGVGGAAFLAGGAIATIRNPRTLDDVGRAMFDPVRKGIPADAQDAFNRTWMNDEKGKWLTRGGLALALLGMAVLYFVGDKPKSPDAAPTTREDVKPKN